MQELLEFVLPESVAGHIPDTLNEVEGEGALPLLTEVLGQLASHLDQLIAQLERVALLAELSFQVTHGLTAAAPEALVGSDDPRQRPLRFGLLPSEVSMAARLVLERAVVVGKFGSKEPSKTDIVALIRTSAAYMQVDLIRELAGLRPDPKMPGMGRVSARKRGRAFMIMYEPEQFDFFGYQRMRESRTLDADPDDTALIEAFQSGVPEQLTDLSDGMVEDLGFGVGDLVDVLVFAQRLNLEHDAQFLALNSEKGRLMFANMSPRCLAAFDYLTFSADYLAVGDLRPSSTRHQRRRIVTHPFIVHDDVLIFSRDILFEACNRWFRYLINGDWPAPVRTRESWPTLNRAIIARRNARGTGAFEPFLEAELDQLGLPWGATAGANREIGRAHITGEIDALVVDAKSGVLWVIEAKDITSDQNLRSLQTELKAMVKTYEPQVSRSVTEVNSDPGAVATHAVREWARRGKVSSESITSVRREVDTVTKWDVRPLIVVRDRSAAEYLIGRTWAISSVSGLRSILVG